MTGNMCMMSKAVRYLGATALVAVFSAMTASTAVAQQDSDVTVWRGVEAGTESGIATDASKRVTVVRGQPSFTAQDLSADTETRAQGLEPVVGLNGWFP